MVKAKSARSNSVSRVPSVSPWISLPLVKAIAGVSFSVRGFDIVAVEVAAEGKIEARQARHSQPAMSTPRPTAR